MSRGEFQLRMGLTQDGELLPKSDIVKSQFATSLEGGRSLCANIAETLRPLKLV